MDSHDVALDDGIADEATSLDRAERRASSVGGSLSPLDLSTSTILAPVPAKRGESSGCHFMEPSKEELLLPCPMIEDDAQMTRAYEAIARQRVEYAPRSQTCIEDVERLREMRRYIFHQSRTLAQQMLAETVPYVVNRAMPGDGRAEPLNEHENRALNKQPLPNKNRPCLAGSMSFHTLMNGHTPMHSNSASTASARFRATRLTAARPIRGRLATHTSSDKRHGYCGKPRRSSEGEGGAAG